MFSFRDPVSSYSHYLASFIALIVTLFLWRFTRGDMLRRGSVMVFGLSMILLYAASGTYHAVQLSPYWLRFFQKIDQSAIYVLIAGTYTPIMAVLLSGRFRVFLLVGIWTLAFMGVASLWLLPKVPHSATVGIYLGMGWFGFIGIYNYYLATGWRGLFWALFGAAVYSVGAICELCQWPVIVPGVISFHEVLHFCDVVGTYAHVIFVVKYVLPYQREHEPARVHSLA